jgi:hypothetical protein
LSLIVAILPTPQGSAAAAPAFRQEFMPRQSSFSGKPLDLATSHAIDTVFQTRWPDDDGTFFLTPDGKIRPAQHGLADRDAKREKRFRTSDGNIGVDSQIDLQLTEAETNCAPTPPEAIATGVIAARPNAGEATGPKQAGISAFAQPIPFVAQTVNRRTDSLPFIQKAQAADAATTSAPAGEPRTAVRVTPRARRWVGGVMQF